VGVHWAKAASRDFPGRVEILVAPSVPGLGYRDGRHPPPRRVLTEEPRC
jgi:hypothetical protein